MKIIVSKEIETVCPVFVGACLEATVKNSAYCQPLWDEINAMGEHFRQTLTTESLKELSGTPRVVHLLLTVTTLIVSWALVPSSFTMHYAHQHYLHRTQEVTPMIFPEKPEEPGYWDFLYYAFTIAVAAQTADVATGTTGIRQITLLQSVISFVFNLAILGLSVNVGAGLLN